MVKYVKLQIKALFFNPSNPISITGFLDTVKLACDTNCIHEQEEMEVLSFRFKIALLTTLNSFMSGGTHNAPVVASVNTVEPTTEKKLLCSYQDIVNYLLTKFANDQAIAKIDFEMMRYTQPASMTHTQFAPMICTPRRAKWLPSTTSQH